MGTNGLIKVEKVLNTKIKSFGGKVTTDFCDNKGKEKTPKINSHYFLLPEIVLDSVYMMKNDDNGDKYFYLEKCKYEERKTKKRRPGASKKK